MLRNLGHLFSMVLICTIVSGLLAQEKGEGPTNLIISYRCEPKLRPEFRKYAQETLVQQFENWKKDGVFADYLILFSSFVDVDTWDMLVNLSFSKYMDTARWKEIEREKPGGLSGEALAIALPVNSYFVDLSWHGTSTTIKRDPSKAVYFVIPYDYSGKGEYKNYAEIYVIPQLEGWVREGVMTNYEIYLNQHPTGKPWDVLFIFEYKDLQAFAQRDVLKWKVRAELKDDPAWKTISEVKWDFRTERETVIADAILPKK